MSVYGWILFGIILIPLLLSFEKRVAYYRNFRFLFPSIIIVGAVFLVWDVAATSRGDWAFNDQFVLGVRWMGIPIEEILFFIVVPYSCLFVYDVLACFISERRLHFPKGGVWLSIVSLFSVAALNIQKPYTLTVALFCVVTIAWARFIGRDLFSSRRYWLFLLVSMLPFLIFNYALTSLPVVTYHLNAFSGLRFLTIPVEDFLYNFALLTMNCKLYLTLRGHDD